MVAAVGVEPTSPKTLPSKSSAYSQFRHTAISKNNYTIHIISTPSILFYYFPVPVSDALLIVNSVGNCTGTVAIFVVVVVVAVVSAPAASFLIAAFT